MSSLALVFALHHYKPNALYVMDEIDAALDFKNVRFEASLFSCHTIVSIFQTSIFILHDPSHDVLMTGPPCLSLFVQVSIVANYIKERTKNAQFVIISLRNNMFELADRLVGIYKTFDATKSVTINPKVFAQATTGMLKSSEDVTTEGEEKSPRPSTIHSTKNSQVEKKITTTLGDATNTRVMA